MYTVEQHAYPRGMDNFLTRETGITIEIRPIACKPNRTLEEEKERDINKSETNMVGQQGKTRSISTFSKAGPKTGIISFFQPMISHACFTYYISSFSYIYIYIFLFSKFLKNFVGFYSKFVHSRTCFYNTRGSRWCFIHLI